MKKKFWRCFVCNDLHYGLRPPEICPTCKVKTAYVEIPEREAKAVLRIPTSEPGFGKQEFRIAIEKFAAPNEFMVNPDVERVDLLLEGMAANEQNHGLRFCPCRLRCKEFEEDLKIVCPCNFLIQETYQGQEKGECWCGLFIKKR